jgi:hypothetical protein
MKFRISLELNINGSYSMIRVDQNLKTKFCNINEKENHSIKLINNCELI